MVFYTIRIDIQVKWQTKVMLMNIKLKSKAIDLS